jgi:hypothetical protein
MKEKQITEVIGYEFLDRSLSIYKQGRDWLFIQHNKKTGEIRRTVCLEGFQQASALMDIWIEKTKLWTN